jgi:choice-of-anchor C domain-containing protein
MNIRRLLTISGTALACVGLVIGGGSKAFAAFNLVNDGSFEQQSAGGDFTDYTAGQTFGGWTVDSGSVDLIGTYWTSQQGAQSVDMNGLSAGTISQTVNGLNVGQNYQLSFYMAGNTAGGPAVKTMTASVNGGGPQAFSFDDAAQSTTNMGWTQETYDFTAASTSTVLTFASTVSAACEPASSASACGPALDNVSIQAVPEATTFTIFAYMMLTGIVLVVRKRLSLKSAA